MAKLQINPNFPLSSVSSFGTGGKAKQLVEVTTNEELLSALEIPAENIWVLGYCANSLISDHGLDGLTILTRNKNIRLEGDGVTIAADSGVWWDDLVKFAIKNNLWGLELASGIPGSVGAAVVGNISAYGQAVADTLQSVEVIDLKTKLIQKLDATELGLAYRYSNFYKELNSKAIIGARFRLSKQQQTTLTYQSALDIALQEGLGTSDLASLRKIILLARANAGSIYDPEDANRSRSAGSFFKNPTVSTTVAEKLMSFEEFGHSKKQIVAQNVVHGGENHRVSAAHVLLAAGFKRGQTWGPVRLNPDHVLKIENSGRANSQQIYNVAQEIMTTVKQNLGVELEPEVQFLGKF